MQKCTVARSCALKLPNKLENSLFCFSRMSNPSGCRWFPTIGVASPKFACVRQLKHKPLLGAYVRGGRGCGTCVNLCIAQDPAQSLPQQANNKTCRLPGAVPPPSLPPAERGRARYVVLPATSRSASLMITVFLPVHLPIERGDKKKHAEKKRKNRRCTRKSAAL